MTVCTDTHSSLDTCPWPVEFVERAELPVHIEQDTTSDEWSDVAPSGDDYDGLDSDVSFPSSPPIPTTNNRQSIAEILPYLDVAVASADAGNVGVVSDSLPSPYDEKPSLPDTQPVDLTQYRTWTDCTGQYKTVALFSGYKNGYLHILKANGVMVRIPTERMSREDVEVVELALMNSPEGKREVVAEPVTPPPLPRGRKEAMPDMRKVRTWRDETGGYSVNAQLIKYKGGMLWLHKVNGVKIRVPAWKMSLYDLGWVERELGISIPRGASTMPEKARI